MQKALITPKECGKMIPVRDGYALCPSCMARGLHTKLIRIGGAEAKDLPLYCRKCKLEFNVNIDQGQCFESRSQ